MRVRGFVIILPALAGGCAVQALTDRPACDASAYTQELDSWKASRANSIAGPEGWITLSGLYWPDEPSYTLGGAGATIPLPGTQGIVGRLLIAAGQAQFVSDSAAVVTARRCMTGEGAAVGRAGAVVQESGARTTPSG